MLKYIISFLFLSFFSTTSFAAGVALSCTFSNGDPIEDGLFIDFNKPLIVSVEYENYENCINISSTKIECKDEDEDFKVTATYVPTTKILTIKTDFGASNTYDCED